MKRCTKCRGEKDNNQLLKMKFLISGALGAFSFWLVFNLLPPAGYGENFYSQNGIIRIVVKNDELRVLFPKTQKDDIAAVLGEFLGKDDKDAKKRFIELLGKSKNLTMVLTSVLDTRDFE